jgi:hypothetical protein
VISGIRKGSGKDISSPLTKSFRRGQSSPRVPLSFGNHLKIFVRTQTCPHVYNIRIVSKNIS